jgi:hypothetical protein
MRKSAGDLGRSKKMNPCLAALKPLRKRQHLGNQLFAAALHNRASELTLIPALQHREVPGTFL